MSSSANCPYCGGPTDTAGNCYCACKYQPVGNWNYVPDRTQEIIDRLDRIIELLGKK